MMAPISKTIADGYEDITNTFFLVPKHSDFPEADISLLFNLDPSTITKVQLSFYLSSFQNKEVPTKSFVRLQHSESETWVHATNANDKQNLYYSRFQRRSLIDL